MKYLLLLLLTFAFISCEYKQHERHCKIHCYQTGEGNDLLFWYLLYNNSGGYYVYQSNTQVTNFSNVSWQKETQMPEELVNVQETAQIEEPLSELPDEIEVEMTDADVHSGENTEPSNNNNNSNESSSEPSSNDAGNNDSGSGSSGD